MSKHPTPWTLSPLGYIVDANDVAVGGALTDDPEARAVLLHAAEMRRALNHLHSSCDAYCNLDDATKACVDLVDKINAEIAKGKP